MTKKKATYKKGDLVIFRIKDIDPLQFSQDDVVLGKIFESLNGCELKVLGLETYTELGDKDYEYYNVGIKEDTIKIKLIGVSGYHLDPQKLEEPKVLKLEDKCPNLFEIANIFDEKGMGEVISRFTPGFIEVAITEMENHSKELSDYGVDVPKLGGALDKLKDSRELDNLDELLNLFL